MEATPLIRKAFFNANGYYATDVEILEWYKRQIDDISKAIPLECAKLEEDIIHNIQSVRQIDYGDAKKSLKSIADFWNVYLKRKRENGCNNLDLDHIDVANMLELMKMSRFAYQRKYDSALDKAAYADFALQFIGTPES